MIKFSDSKNIYLYTEKTDMRMGMNKIQILIACNFSRIEIRNSIFVFCSTKGDQIKIYYEDDYGCWLLQNKLFDTKFKWPKGLEIGTKINYKQLEGLCKGLEVIESKRPKQSITASYY